jgi:hypothetical protein
MFGIRPYTSIEEGSHERLCRLGRDVVVEILPARTSFVVGHGERLLDRVGGSSGVPWLMTIQERKPE